MEQNDDILAEMEEIQCRIAALEKRLEGDATDAEKDDVAGAIVSYQDDLSALYDSLEDDDYVAALMTRKVELVKAAQEHTEVLMRANEPRNWPLETLQALGRIHQELGVIQAELDEEMSPLQKSEEAALMAERAWWLMTSLDIY